MNFRDKAKEIKERGAAERRNFTPRGVPLKMYNYWLNNSRTSIVAIGIQGGYRKENFCHYWRVVALWAPLLWLLNFLTAKKMVVSYIVLLSLAALAGLTMVFVFGQVEIFLEVLGGILATCLALALLFLSVYGMSVWFDSWNKRTRDKFKKISGYVLFSLALFAVLAGIVALGTTVGWLLLLLSVSGALLTVAVCVAVGYIILKRRVKNDNSRVKDFASGVGDFAVLASQVVAVKKWKICPFVDIKVRD